MEEEKGRADSPTYEEKYNALFPDDDNTVDMDTYYPQAVVVEYVFNNQKLQTMENEERWLLIGKERSMQVWLRNMQFRDNQFRYLLMDQYDPVRNYFKEAMKEEDPQKILSIEKDGDEDEDDQFKVIRKSFVHIAVKDRIRFATAQVLHIRTLHDSIKDHETVDNEAVEELGNALDIGRKFALDNVESYTWWSRAEDVHSGKGHWSYSDFDIVMYDEINITFHTSKALRDESVSDESVSDLGFGDGKASVPNGVMHETADMSDDDISDDELLDINLAKSIWSMKRNDNKRLEDAKPSGKPSIDVAMPIANSKPSEVELLKLQVEQLKAELQASQAKLQASQAEVTHLTKLQAQSTGPTAPVATAAVAGSPPAKKPRPPPKVPKSPPSPSMQGAMDIQMLPSDELYARPPRETRPGDYPVLPKHGRDDQSQSDNED